MKLWIAAALICIPVLIHAEGPRPTLDTARALYLKGVEGDRDASRDSLKLFEALQQEHPEDMRILAYLGSVRVLESGRTMALWKRGKLAKEGLEALDKAVAAAPSRVEIRFLRAVSTFHLPGYFDREKQSASDLAQIAATAEKSVTSGELDPRFAAAALYRHGVVLERNGKRADAETAWKAALRTAPGSRSATEAAQHLKKR